MTAYMPVSILWGVIILLALTGCVVTILLLRERELRKQRGAFREWPIRHILPEDFDSMFEAGPHGPSIKTEIRTVGAYRVDGGIGDFETWIICNLAKNSKSIFEFGTCTGKTTYLMAANAPGATVTTLTLHPDELVSYQEASGDDRSAVEAAKQVSAFNSFYYEKTVEAERITQLYGDSKAFDPGAYKSTMDLIFVDGSHARSYVESDSRKALEMVKPGGIVLWHDYRGPRIAKDVFFVLNNLANEIDLVRIANTSFVAYRAPM